MQQCSVSKSGRTRSQQRCTSWATVHLQKHKRDSNTKQW